MGSHGYFLYYSLYFPGFFFGGEGFWPHRPACGTVPQPGVEPGPWQWKRQILTSRPPRTSPRNLKIYIQREEGSFTVWLQAGGLPSWFLQLTPDCAFPPSLHISALVAPAGPAFFSHRDNQPLVVLPGVVVVFCEHLSLVTAECRHPGGSLSSTRIAHMLPPSNCDLIYPPWSESIISAIAVIPFCPFL